MSELLKKYESIDQSKLSEATIKILNRVKTITADFTADDAKNNDIADKVMDEILKKNPDAVKIVKREPKAKPAPKKIHKAKGTHKAKATHKATSAPATKTSSNNIMSVAKEIQKTGESWKDAMERAKQVLKERKEQNVQKSRTEMEKLLALVRTKKELQGFANSDIKRDSVRDAKPRGARFVTKEGTTTNQYGTYDNKLGRKYWETRDRHADRLAPNYPKDMPKLASGGALPDEYTRVVRWADGNYRVEIKRMSMDFARTFNDVFEDKERAEKFAKKIAENNHVNYIGVGTMPYDFRKSNLPEKEFLEEYYKKNKFANGGSFAPNVADGTQFMNGVYAKGGSVKKGAVKVGVFSSEDLKTNVFEKALAKKSEETGLTKIDLILIKKGGETFIEFYLIPNSESAKDVLIKDWYTKTYPTDDLGEELNDSVTFEDLWSEDYKKYNVYQVIGVGDSLIRERLFERLAEIKGVGYDVVYKKLFSSDGFYADGGSFAPNVADGTQFMNGVYKNGGNITNEEKLIKELHKLQRDLNSSRLSQYREGDTSQEEMDRQRERESKLVRFYEVLETLRQSDAKFADGGGLEFMTDPNFGNFQNTGMFDDGGSLITETVSAIFNPNQKRGKIETGFGSKTKEGLFAMMTNVNYSPEEITTAVFVPNAKKGRIYTEWGAKNKEGLHEMVENMRNTFEHGGIMASLTEQEFLKKYFGANVFTENPSQYFEIKKMSSSDDAKVNAFVKELKADGFTVKKRAYSNFTSVMGVKKKGSFAKGGKTGMKAQQGQINDLKKYVPLADKENVEILAEAGNDNGDTFRGSFIAKYGKQNFRIENGKLVRKFELGGAFMMTDLAGHTGGSDGLGNPMPLSGVSGTHYTGLVGETGAMSSGELFARGGGVGDNVLGLKKGDIYKIIDTFHTASYDTTMSVFTFIDYEEKFGEIVLKSIPFPPNPKKKNDFIYVSDVSSDGIKVLNDEEIGQVISRKYKNFVENNYEAGGAMMANQQVIDDASQPYVITESFGNPAQQLGMFKEGGSIENQYEGRTAEDVWNNLSVKQRKHFLIDHFVKVEDEEQVEYDNLDEEQKEFVDEYSKYTWKNLDWVKIPFKKHVKMGQYAYGGRTKSRPSMRELYIEQIASLTRTRATGVDAFAKEHNLTDSELSNLMTGLGRKMISQSDFITALVGDKGNPKQKQVVAFAKAGNAYKMTDGGSFAPNVADGTQFMNGVYADGGINHGKGYRDDSVYAQEFFEEDGLGEDYIINGIFDDEKFEENMLARTRKPRAEAVIKIWSRALGMDSSKYLDGQIIENIQFTNDSTKRAKHLFEVNNKKMANGGSFAPNVADGTQFMNGVYAEGGSINGMLNKKIQKLADKKGLTMDALGRDEFNKAMTQALVESLTDANFHDEAKQVVVKAEGKTKWSDDLYRAESFNPDAKITSFAREVARTCEWDGDDILNAYYFITKMQGSKVAGMIDDLFLNPKPTQSSSKPTKYIDHDDIESVTLNVNGNFVTFAGKDFLNGANLMEKGGDLSKIATYFPKRDIVKVTLKNGDTIKPLNGYWLKKGSEPMGKKTTSTPPKTGKVTSPNYPNVNFNHKVVINGKTINLALAKSYKTGLDDSKQYDFIDVDGNPLTGYGFSVKEALKQIEDYGNNPIHYSKSTPPKIDETKAHFKMDVVSGGKFEVFVDSNFVNQSQGNLPNTELKHYGFGDFYLQTPDGNIDFIRTSEEKQGFVGRTHKMKGSDELVLKLVNAMKEKGRFESTQTFANGGSFAPNVYDGTQFMNGVYADGGSTGSGFDPVKVKVAMAIGLDRAIEFYDAEYPIRPYQLLQRAVRGGYITLDEITEEVVDSAMETARDSEDMDEVGSSDFGAYLRDFLDEAGFKVGYVNGRLTREYADGGGVSKKLDSGVYRVGKPTKVSSNLYEQKIVEIFDNGDIATASDYGRKLVDFKSQKYPIISKEQLDAQFKMANGGEIRRFNRHEQMDSETREEVLDVLSEPQLNGSLTNYLYGLYDGYDYSETENFKKEMSKLKSKDLAMYDRINAIYKKIDKYKFEKYDEYADGGMFDDNDGFMRADNERSFRYPEREVRVDSLDESVDLTNNVSYQPNEVVIRTLDENIDLNDDNRIRARMGSNPMNRNPNKMMAVNPRMVFTDLPKPTSSTHKND